MTWYVLKTWTGREEELVREIRRTVPPSLYDDAFVIYSERIWRRQGRNIIHQEILFPGCAFLTCRDTEPLFARLRQIPALNDRMADGSLAMYPLMEKDAEFLENISGGEHVVRLSRMRQKGNDFRRGQQDCPAVKAGQKETDRYLVSGPLECCVSDIESIAFRKRFAKLHRKLWGEDKTFAVGILLNEDLDKAEEPELAYDRLERAIG